MPRLSYLRRRLPVDLQFKDVSYSVPEESCFSSKGHKMILKRLSGKFCSGELIGIMGSNGAGKTILMDILAGKRESEKGLILVNGQQLKLQTFKKLSCYITKRDSLIPNLTVLESMMLSANLNVKATTAVKRDMVNETLNALLLKEYADVQTSILSVGHQKLLSIALELLRNPSVMFLDEPTSTVCGYFSFKVISLLKSLAQSGRTIVCIIHQPCCDILNLFDKLYILSQGQCVYSGTVSYLTTFLAKFGLHCRKYHSPAALIMKEAAKSCEIAYIFALQNGLCTMEQQKSITSAKESASSDPSQCQSKDVDPMESDEFVTSTFSQFCVLLKRSFIYDYLQLNLVLQSFVSIINTGFMLGLVYLNGKHDIMKVPQNQGCVFFIVCTMLASIKACTILLCPLQMPVVLKEHHNNWYSLKAYYLAKMMSDMPMQIIGPIIYCCIAYWMTSQPPKATLYVLFAGLLILVAFVTQSVGQFIAAMCDSLMGANAMAWVVGAIMCIFGGFFGPFDELASYVRWITYLSNIRYSFGGMVLSLYGINRTDLECAEGIYPLQKPETILKELKNDEAKLVVDIHILVIYFIIFHLAAYLALCYKARPSRRKTEYKN
ncbi:ATP-binding cassette sub-family G member 4-like isoform X2 [Erpetoichthys calabaricus]|uniref:ATP-binding cassette sub-family G member 4-like isoform X2 n=1 Tax=Erpetoichthys calabaricus TaxID=27687 RepID=UPI00223446D9|nr:ATP-binding cassette sub-family G member 4-like isoform X2 [Erpetoichthys calabaricus]